MSTFWRRLRLVVMLLMIGGGCNPLMLPFLFTSDIPKMPAELFDLYDNEKDKKEIKVVLVTDTGLDTRAEFIHADREISRCLYAHLQRTCKENEEKVTVINPLKVEEYRNSHPDWSCSHQDLEALGKHFKAKFVIVIEASELSLYQERTANSFYQGRANLRVSVVDVKKSEDFAVQPFVTTFTYPSEARGGSMFADTDMTPQAFRAKFFNAMARQLTGYFTELPTRDKYHMD